MINTYCLAIMVKLKVCILPTSYGSVARIFNDKRSAWLTFFYPVIPKIEPGTPAAKIVDESVEQGLIIAARQLVQRSSAPIQIWEQCLDLYDRQPALNTRTSTSILQQAYSTESDFFRGR